MEKVFQLFSFNFQKNLVYRGNFIINSLFGLLPLLVKIYLWIAVYESTKVDSIGGYNLSKMITYFIVVFIIDGITAPRMIARSISNDIRDGMLNSYLLKPINYIYFRFNDHIANRFTNFVVMLIPLGIFLSMNSSFISLDKKSILGFVPMLIISFVMQFYIYTLIGLSVFWTEESSSLFDLWSQIGGLLSGMYFPLTMLPEPLVVLSNFLPFKYLIYYPVQLMTVGIESGGDYVINMVFALFWLLLLHVGVKKIWKSGIKKYSAFGM